MSIIERSASIVDADRSWEATPMTTHRHYIPAMGHSALTPLYDPFIRFLGREATFKRRLVSHLGLGAGQRVLDVGCGTGTLAILIRQARADIEVTGIDGDPDIVERARRKSDGDAVDFRTADATALPFADGSFDRVTSTLMAHHLATSDKQKMFAEIRRVLTPDGQLHLVDAGPAASRWGRVLQRWFAPTQLADNLDGKLPSLMSSAGLTDIVEEDRVLVALGPLVFWRARRGAQRESGSLVS
jgi:ubiquinone/menaquinone biosynthesis C-methylase UbiE